MKLKKPQAQGIPETLETKTAEAGKENNKRGVEHRRYRRSVTPDDILGNLIDDYLTHKTKKRRKRMVTKKLRKEYRMLTRAERLDYHKAINMLKQSVRFDILRLLKI
ncbi:hypothetical protein KUTeg_020527 [Tegillarca granosa]|uniref:Uncharacterized protein n=1 Tax=Tegillarca granosa TaxID=220873 RepID=A0ABQ9EDF6_TEGGR|nr:hypothetical protein KUTeg_020527 [Tegillarca granosa]